MKQLRVKMWHRKIWIAASVFEEFWNLCNAANSCPLLNFHSTRERCQECRTKKKFWVPIRNQGKNFIIDLFMKDVTHNSLCGSVVEHQRVESKVLRFYSSWGLMRWPVDSWIFFCPMLATRQKNIFLYFFTNLKTNHLSYSISIELADRWEHTKTTKPLCTSQWIHLT